MATTWYIWKWADNDLPGRPPDIAARLCAGEFPQALQPFCPKQVLCLLIEVADKRRTEMSELFFETREHSPGQASFICVCDHATSSSWLDDKLCWAAWHTSLTLYDECANRLLGRPKRNKVELPDQGRQLVDILPSDIPALLDTLKDCAHLTALACYDKCGNMFQVWANEQRLAVEWQILPEHDFNLHRIWVAGRPAGRQRHVRFGRRKDLFSNEILGIAEVQRLWEAFLAGSARPEGYSWRDITSDLNDPKHTPRARHQPKEEHPPL